MANNLRNWIANSMAFDPSVVDTIPDTPAAILADFDSLHSAPVIGASGNLAYDFANLEPVTWLVDQHNVAHPPPTKTGWRISATSNIDFTGVVSAPDNSFFLVFNASDRDIKFKFNDTDSLEGNQFFPFTGSDITLGKYASVYIRYDVALDVGGCWTLVNLQH